MKEEEGIILSEKHGVNPSLEVCALCGNDIGVILFGKLKDDEEAPKKVCMNHICDECKNKLKENEEILFLASDKYIKVPYKNINPNVLEKMKKDMVVYLSDSQFNEIFK